MKLSDYIKPHPGPQTEALKLIGKGKIVFYGGSRGGGKSLYINDLALTDSGWKKAGEITFDDKLATIDGTYTTITGIYPQKDRPIYEIVFQDGQTVRADAEHNWLVKSSKHGKRDGWVVRQTTELSPGAYTIPTIEKPAPGGDYSGPDPYWVGYMLGNGTLTGTNQAIYTDEDEIVDLLRAEGWHCYRYSYSTCYRMEKGGKEYVKYLGKVSGDMKHIPEEMLLANPEVRLALLQGLMDSDGTCDKQGRASFCTTNENLRDGVVYLARSLGGRSNWHRVDKVTDRGGRGYYYDVSVSYGEKFIPFRLTRKRERCIKQKLYNVGIKSITRIENADAVCFSVEHPSHLFIANDFVVTHNSHMALDAAFKACLRHKSIQVGCFRQTYPELEEVFIQQMKRRFPDNVFKYKYRDKHKTAFFPNGSRIIFKSCETEADVKKAQGAEYQFLIIDEAPNWDIITIQKLMGSCRNARLSDFSPTVLMTGNPGGISDQWFIDHFVQPNYDKWAPGELKNKERYMFIPAKVGDNPSLDASYIDMLESLPEALRDAWLHGVWGVFEGQFFEMWNQNVHVIPQFKIPDTWHVRGGFDLGYSEAHPSVGLWGAQDPDSGRVYVFQEYVGSGAVETHARPMAEMCGALGQSHVVYADPSMWDETRKLRDSDESPARMFLSAGVPIMPANNSRVNGWRIVKSWLNYTTSKEPMLYVMDSCPQLITTLPKLRYAKAGKNSREDLDTKMCDDATDALRYMMVSGFGYPGDNDLDPTERTLVQDIRSKVQSARDGIYNDYRGYDFLEDTRPVAALY